MAEESLIEGEDENILYDLLVITEWPPETDIQVTRASICAHSDIMFRPPVEYLVVKTLPESAQQSDTWCPPLKAT